MIVRQGLREDLLTLMMDCKHVPLATSLDRILARNDWVYRVLERDNSIVGFYALFPFSERAYIAFTNGSYTLPDIPDHVVSYGTDIETFLLLLPPVYAPESPFADEILRWSRLDLPVYLRWLRSQGVKIHELAVSLTTHRDQKFLDSLNIATTPTSEVYLLDTETLLRS